MKISDPKNRRSTNLEWIRCIPSTWKLVKLKRLSSIRGRIGFRGYTSNDLVGPEEGALTIGGKHINSNNELELSDPTFLSWDKYYESPEIVISVGDIVFVQRGSLGKVALIKDKIGPATINPSMILLKNIFPKAKYLYWVLSSKIVQEQVDLASSATAVPMISQEHFGNFFIPVPPVDFQHYIASFLKKETSSIDTLIAKKERQIELLREKRSTLINHAVTKGLNPDAKMKDSGVEWLGEIPENCKLLRFKFAIVLQRGHDLPVLNFIDGPYPVYGSNGTIGYHNQYTTKGPGITVGRSGSVGEVNYVKCDFWAHNTALYAKQLIAISPKYAYYLLKALNVKYLSEGTAVGTLNRNYIHNLLIVLPKEEDQARIEAFLDQKTSQIDKMIKKVNNSIELLHEYRTALIAATITGKIEVRKEAA